MLRELFQDSEMASAASITATWVDYKVRLAIRAQKRHGGTTLKRSNGSEITPPVALKCSPGPRDVARWANPETPQGVSGALVPSVGFKALKSSPAMLQQQQR